jgi:hypothetical protein
MAVRRIDWSRLVAICRRILPIRGQIDSTPLIRTCRVKRRYLLDDIPRPKRGRKLPVILSPEEVAQLIGETFIVVNTKIFVSVRPRGAIEGWIGLFRV